MPVREGRVGTGIPPGPAAPWTAGVVHMNLQQILMHRHEGLHRVVRGRPASPSRPGGVSMPAETLAVDVARA